MTEHIVINGEYAPQFKPVYDQLYHNLDMLNEVGAAVCIYHGGKRVAHIYGVNKHVTRSLWQADDYVSVMSCSKAFLALCIHTLAAKGKLSLNAPVRQYWPEFGQNGKQDILISMVLAHTAGVPVCHIGDVGDIFDWQQNIHNLEQTKATFKAGDTLAYHALTYGHILGEIIRRVDGRMPSVFFQEEIAAPFGLAVSLNKPTDKTVRPIKETADFSKTKLCLSSKWLPKLPFWQCQYFRQCSEQYQPNSKLWSHSEIPAVTGHATAHGMAKLYAFLANQGELENQVLLPSNAVSVLKQLHVSAKEAATKTLWYMGSGFMLNSPELCRFGPNPNSFGHMGMGGAVGFADPDNNLAFAYVTEHFHGKSKKDKSIAGKRMQSLIEACYRCI